MQDDDIDLERTVTDPAYRRRVVERLNAEARGEDSARPPSSGALHAADDSMSASLAAGGAARRS